MTLDEKQVSDVANAIKQLIGAGIDVLAKNFIEKSTTDNKDTNTSEKPELDKLENNGKNTKDS